VRGVGGDTRRKAAVEVQVSMEAEGVRVEGWRDRCGRERALALGCSIEGEEDKMRVYG
jgi:hypothetical protein